MAEIWDLYDRDGNRTGETWVRGFGNYKDIPEGRYHLGVDILVVHEDGTYLLMKRSDDKDSVTLQEGETVAYKWLDKEAFLEYVDSENAIGSHNQRFEKYINTLRC